MPDACSAASSVATPPDLIDPTARKKGGEVIVDRNEEIAEEIANRHRCAAGIERSSCVRP